ncbi:unnamed protein product [Prorocentrum cordatum]|uniref:GED domain-containing protein n=1 Tax=Prorocentrum cordatum TaxID=2364126 RepID=A0ABN9W4I1_9DINO|nr:unnamed protein product [Polarella glacialis]
MTQNIIQEQKDAARVIVEQQVASYTGYLFTNDSDYLTSHGSMEPMYKADQQKTAPAPEEEKKEPGQVERMAQQVKDQSKAAYQGVSGLLQGQGQEQKRRSARYSGPFVQEIRKRLDSYLAITVRNVRDSIPKAIGFYLVRGVQDKLQFELLNALNKKDRISELLGEPPHIMEERKVLMQQLQVLQRASGVLTRDPTLAAIAFEAEEEEEQQQQQAPARRPAPAAAGPGATAAAAQRPAPVISSATPSVPAAGGVSRALGASGQPGAGAPALPASTGVPRPSPAPAVGGGGLFGAPAAPAARGGGGLFDDGAPAAKKAPGATKNPLFGE